MFPQRPDYVKFGKSSSSKSKPEGLYDAVVTKVVYEGTFSLFVDTIVEEPSTSFSVGVDGLVGSINETGLRPRIYAKIPRLVSGFEFGPLDFIGPVPSVGDRAFVGFKEGNTDNIVLLTKGAQVSSALAGASSELEGLTFGGILTFTSDSSFTKASYPDLEAVVVHAQGGGGAGGGAAETSNEASMGQGGGGGAYARSFILASSLGASEAITVGAAGTGVTGSSGTDGGNSSFGSLVTADGGLGGLTQSAGTSGSINDGADGGAGTGDFVIPGGKGGGYYRSSGTDAKAGGGGSSFLSNPTSDGLHLSGIPGNLAGDNAVGYGGGGSGSLNVGTVSATSGGEGAPGIVLVELWFKELVSGGGGGGGGSHDLDDLTDVVVIAPTTGQLIRFNGTEWVNTTLSLDDLSNTNISNPVVGDFLTYDGADWTNASVGPLEGFTYGGFVAYGTGGSPFSFTKASYPSLGAVVVHTQGGGGAGGGATTTGASQTSGGNGGDGGGYAQKLILVDDLASSETVTVGAGGTGVSGTTGNAGGNSTFGSHCTGGGGGAGATANASGTPTIGAPGSSTGGASGGDLNIDGEAGDPVIRVSATAGAGGKGGNSFWGNGGTNNAGSSDGSSGAGYGAGGGGAHNAQSQGTARTGGAGTNGIVMVELWLTEGSLAGGGGGGGEGGDAGLDDVLMLMGG